MTIHKETLTKSISIGNNLTLQAWVLHYPGHPHRTWTEYRITSEHDLLHTSKNIFESLEYIGAKVDGLEWHVGELTRQRNEYIKKSVHYFSAIQKYSMLLDGYIINTEATK
tara:strand:+ start:443 stop:775 length:333 start_codon:yes stop_codon:yes gene_type:complete